MNRLHHLNLRALVALLMLFSFIGLPLAGIALHFSEDAPFAPTRHLLMTFHNLSATIFLISVLLHLKLNWKPLTNYLRMALGKGMRYREEFGVAIVIVVATLALGVVHVFVRGG